MSEYKHRITLIVLAVDTHPQGTFESAGIFLGSDDW